MGFRLVFDVLFILSIIVSPAKSDLIFDDLPLSDTELPLNDDALAFNPQALPLTDDTLAFNQQASPVDLTSSPQEGSDSLFGDTGNIDLFSTEYDGVWETSQLAGCTSSELLPAIGKSRLRRRDGTGACENLDTTAPTDAGAAAYDDFLRNLEETTNRKALGTNNLDLSINCAVISGGQLPWEICSSGDHMDRIRSGWIDINPNWLSAVLMHDLNHCTLGMYCPKRSSLALIIDLTSIV